jgi:hypothetical protein
VIDHLSSNDFIAMTSIVRSNHAHAHWNETERRTVWWLICTSRKRLGLPLDPVVATAFVILQRYFRDASRRDCALIHLITAALLLSCKIVGIIRRISVIFHELVWICKTVPSRIIRVLFSVDKLSDTATARDLAVVSRAEMSLLFVINFDCTIEIPFSHLIHCSVHLTSEIWSKIVVSVCLLICSEHYLDIPPEVAAAVAAHDVLGPREWMVEVLRRYGEEPWNLAVQMLQREKSRTARRGLDFQRNKC